MERIKFPKYKIAGNTGNRYSVLNCLKENMMHAFGNNLRAVGVYDGKIAGLYDLEETLGSGHFAVVKLARHVFTGEKVAVKVIDKTKLDDVSRAHLFQEVRCMKLVQHPNVVRLYEVIDTQTKLYLILELGDGGDLYDYIIKHESGLFEDVARLYFRQIVQAISYCHQLHVVHRDLKPENVVFFKKLGVVKLTDFGFSNKFCPGQKLETSCGSLAYSAPEILLGDSYDAPAVDIWSLGVILYMLVCGRPPFQEANDSETLTMIMDCKYTIPSHVSIECRRLISLMLVREPDQRANLQKIAQDPWLTKNNADYVPEYIPLVTREQVSDDEHALIIHKMINGNIATKEEILEALDRNDYNHITATYFLLAERKLRSQRKDANLKKDPTLKSISRQTPKNCGHGNFKVETKQVEVEIDNFVTDPSNSQSPANTICDDKNRLGRFRKCSIVQEEEDDNVDCTVTEIPSVLSRRGSRSEGRLNIAVLDRLADVDRIKKEGDVSFVKCLDNKSITGGIFDDMYINLVKIDAVFPEKLESTTTNIPVVESHLYSTDILKADDTDDNFSKSSKSCAVIKGPSQVDKELKSNYLSTRILTDSNTIPITTSKNCVHWSNTKIPKYKTMPSPTRTNSTTHVADCLNEICEGGDETSHCSHSCVSNYLDHSEILSYSQRRKCYKSRNTSCSSSDASDDDSEHVKKRTNKIIDQSLKPIQSYRRDSYDDSSDSQDPSTGTASGPASNSNTCHININKKSQKTNSNSTNSKGNCDGNYSRQKRKMHRFEYRRYRKGYRSSNETRLRESQSLNRISEVQELEINCNSSIVQTEHLGLRSDGLLINSSLAFISSFAPILTASSRAKCFSERLLQNIRKTDKSSSICHEDIKFEFGVDLNNSMKSENKHSKASKKLTMIGRYFHII